MDNSTRQALESLVMEELETLDVVERLMRRIDDARGRIHPSVLGYDIEDIRHALTKHRATIPPALMPKLQTALKGLDKQGVQVYKALDDLYSQATAVLTMLENGE